MRKGLVGQQTIEARRIVERELAGEINELARIAARMRLSKTSRKLEMAHRELGYELAEREARRSSRARSKRSALEVEYGGAEPGRISNAHMKSRRGIGR